jgi:inosose dehydratase
MSETKIGCVPLNWGQFQRQNPAEWPQERVLREVAAAGFAGVSWGARKDLSTHQSLELLKSFGLEAAPGYMGGDWWLQENQEKAIEGATHLSRYLTEIGVEQCFISAGGFDAYASRRNGKTRRQLAGQVQEGDGLTEDEWKILAETCNKIGEAMQSMEVQACYHNHVGAVVETREEMEKLLSLTDRELVFLGPDTGHLEWAGADAAQFFRDFAPLIKAAHLKDVSHEVRDRGVREGWGYDEFVEAQMFRELGEGDVDFKSILQVLGEHSFNGWLLSETDRTFKDTPLESGRISREHLKALGV